MILRSNSRLRRYLGTTGVKFLEHAAGAIERILPHIEVSGWRQAPWAETQSVWGSSHLTEIKITLGIGPENSNDSCSLMATVQRRSIPGAGTDQRRSLDTREYDICKKTTFKISAILQNKINQSDESSLLAVKDAFDEIVISEHLISHQEFKLDIGQVMDSMHKLSEESYENKSITFGCILDPGEDKGGQTAVFPQKLTGSKKHKALSDGFRTAYHVSAKGSLIGFVDLEQFEKTPLSGHHYYPEWAEQIAKASRGGRCGVCLSRQGDILVFDEGTLRFTYRYGRWQYWNHSHLVTLLKERSRAQNVSPAVIGKVVAQIYRAVLDISFRRSGALFVILRNRNSLRDIVRFGDAIEDTGRSDADQQLDHIFRNRNIQTLPRSVLVELASLDGAVVIDNQGFILAYGAVLDPKKRGRLRGTEGSRTKAAIGASNYGISLKVSSDGDITIFHQGAGFIKV